MIPFFKKNHLPALNFLHTLDMITTNPVRQVIQDNNLNAQSMNEHNVCEPFFKRRMMMMMILVMPDP